MLFNSTIFLLFFPIVLIIYFAIPDKAKNIFLLIASYYFYMSWNPKYAILILTVTVVTYVSGLMIDRFRHEFGEKKRAPYIKLILIAGLIVPFGLLFVFKYTNFSLGLFGWIMSKIGINITVPVFDVLLPVGISFYTFQAVGYIVDVYRGTIEAEHSFFKYALFVSFFPQLVAGPIERSGNLLSQLTPHKFDYENFRDGFMLMIWGYFLKLVIADRAAIFVNAVYGDYVTYSGAYIIVATMLFSVQIYCDFMGYTVIAMGAARILGIKLTDNFNAPYLSGNVAEFWRRWHISLTSWFRDYLYFPLGGSRKGKLRKCINIMIVFMVSGLWHGANLAFVLWGGLNGLYQIIGEALLPVRKKIRETMHISPEWKIYRLAGILITYCLVTFSWLFFRAGALRDCVGLLRNLFASSRTLNLLDGESLYACGLDRAEFIVLLTAILVLLITDILKSRGIIIREMILRQPYLIRLLAIPVFICIILLFGIYGPEYEESAFIYFQF